MPQNKIKVVIGEKNLRIGGTQRLAVDQLTLLNQDLFELHLITLVQWPDRHDFYDLIPPGVNIHKLNFKGIRDVWSWVALFKILRKIRPDVVKSSGFFGNTIFRTLKPFVGYASIAAEHNTQIRRSTMQTLLNRMLNVITYVTVGDSEMVVSELAASKGFTRDKLMVIHNGVDISAIRSAEQAYGPKRDALRSGLNIDSRDVVFLCIARFIKQKNHTLMIEAFEKCARANDRARLLLVGSGLYLKAAQDQIRALGIDGKVIMVGEQKKLHPFYVLSDFFIMTSRHEGFSIVSMEGLAFGLPLISTRVGGISGYLIDGQNGFFTEADPSSIATALNKALELPPQVLVRLKDNARMTADSYSLERYGKAYEDLFIRAAGKVTKGDSLVHISQEE